MQAEQSGSAGPYVITTTIRRQLDSGGSTANEVLSRRAVATLEEAVDQLQPVVRAVANPCTRYELVRQLRLMGWGEPGGSVGPLPDGTVIEVKRKTWPVLMYEAGMDGLYAGAPDQQVEIVAAFNAREASRVAS